MPTPNINETEADYIARCVPIVMAEGKTQDQALGQCYGMYRQQAEGARKAKVHETMQKERPS
ncbi:MAG: hypothetical protein ABIJ57_09510 [Pseudomonadota bacterium]|uniref:Uncharacterized protein n=1 Tax=viral metagenome TaxID=1070528 RepID=A0A6M3J6M4_9ZZZZ